MPILIASRADLTLKALRKVAWGGAELRLAPSALDAMARARDRLEALIEEPDTVIYGVTSGYGQMAHLRFTPEERRAHATHVSTAPMASWGEPLPERVARAIVVARLANFIEGHAGISPALADGVVRLLDGALPQVPRRGQGGAGEILSLSHLFHPLMTAQPLREKDALSLVNGAPASAGLAGDAALAAEGRLSLSARVFALAAEGFNTPHDHFHPQLSDYWGNDHDRWALECLTFLKGGERGGARRAYQAPVSYRIIPRILGQARLAERTAREVAAHSLAAVTDNPVLLPPEAGHPNGRAISTGGFHNAVTGRFGPPSMGGCDL